MIARLAIVVYAFATKPGAANAFDVNTAWFVVLPFPVNLTTKVLPSPAASVPTFQTSAVCAEPPGQPAAVPVCVT